MPPGCAPRQLEVETGREHTLPPAVAATSGPVRQGVPEGMPEGPAELRGLQVLSFPLSPLGSAEHEFPPHYLCPRATGQAEAPRVSFTRTLQLHSAAETERAECAADGVRGADLV